MDQDDPCLIGFFDSEIHNHDVYNICPQWKLLVGLVVGDLQLLVLELRQGVIVQGAWKGRVQEMR